MIQFNELKFNQDGTILTIDIEVKDLPYFTDVYIDRVDIDSQDTYVGTGVSSTPVYTYTEPTNSKTLVLELDTTDIPLDLSNNMFFVYVTVKGTPDPTTPDYLNIPVTLGVVIHMYPFYQSSLAYLSEIGQNCGQTCQMPKKFIDHILRMKALELSLNTGHYTQAISYWEKFFKVTT